MDDFGIFTLLPAVLAVGLALWTKNVIVSLFAAVWAACAMLVGGNPATALLHAVDPFLINAIKDVDHIKMLVFTLLVAGMVGVLGKSGATLALVGTIARYARTPRSAQVMSWLSGLFIFFDDYANCLIVGNTMRPVADRLRVSRAKLAYLVDSTAAPVAMLALVSTWVGVEVGYIHDGLRAATENAAQIGMAADSIPQDAYAFFIKGWGYRFYPILALVFVGAVAISGRDFGPMRRAEAEAQAREQQPGETVDVPLSRMWIAIASIATLLGVTVAALYLDGKANAAGDAALFTILGAANSFDAMVTGSLAGLVMSCTLSLAYRALTVGNTVDAVIYGMKEIFEALVVLHLAWALADSMGKDNLNTAGYLVPLVKANLPAMLLPTVVFVVAAAMSFATGTSFGTMGILMPLVIPAAYGVSPDSAIALATSGSVMAGACFGDHCSPISDTTVLSSVGSGCDLVVHVRTQLPYALVVGGIAIAFGTLPAGLGVPWWISVPLGAAACIAVVRFVGKPAAAAA